MKKLLLFALICSSISITKAQDIQGTINQQSINWTTALQNLPTSQIASGILYNKVTQFSNLISYNRSDYNTANYEMFNQAISELHRASNQNLFISSASLSSTIGSSTSSNNVKVGIINTSFQFLNFNENTPSNGGLNYNNGVFSVIPNKPAFFTKKVTVCAPLKKYLVGSNAIFNFSSNLIFNNATSNIKNLVVNFGDGTNVTVINNSIITNPNVTVNYTTSGKKTLTFNITFSDNSTLTTYGEINFNYVSTYISLASTNSQSPCYESLRDKTIFTSNIEYQGYEETSPVYGKIEVFTYYRTNNNNTERKVKKPIFIIDGFDPEDTRKVKDCDCANDPECSKLDKYKDANQNFDPSLHNSIEDVSTYYENNIPISLIDKLRSLGYDVIVINNPTYTTTNFANQIVKIDGGADYIERNAMNMVSFIQYTKSQLITNGSNEKIVIVGPSMGGQISRYALAYMDKKFAETNNDLWKHNTKLWVSVDSPHLGANIPLSVQATVYCLGYVADKEEAKIKYNKLLNSVAAREQLIYQFNQFENGSPYNSLFNNYYNSLNSNGVAGSNGYPLSTPTFRKIALTNGSLSGNSTNNDSGTFFAQERQKYLSIRGYIDLSFLFFNWSITTFRNINKFLPNPGGTEEIYRYTQFFNPTTFTADNHFNFTVNNNDYRGNFDIMPGGMFNAQEDIQTSILKGLSEQNQRSDFTPLFKNHSFIPTFSSLGHLQPIQNWSNPLNFNLKCSTNNLTPFDSYYGEALNSRHTSFTKESVEWLLKELAGNPQSPNFPLQVNLLSGPDILCNPNTVYSFPDICKIPSPVKYIDQNGNPINGWSVSPNLQIDSSTPYSIFVSSTANGIGEGFITATFQNGQKVTKTIWVGKPSFTLAYNYFDAQPIKSTVCVASDIPNLSLAQQGVTNISFRLCNSTTPTSNGMIYCTMPRSSCCIEATVTNICGTTTMFYDCSNRQSSNTNYYKIYPNPSSDIVNVELRDTNNLPDTETIISGELFDMMGQTQTRVAIVDHKATFSVQGLNKGIYILKIYINNQVESHQVGVE